MVVGGAYCKYSIPHTLVKKYQKYIRIPDHVSRGGGGSGRGERRRGGTNMAGNMSQVQIALRAHVEGRAVISGTRIVIRR